MSLALVDTRTVVETPENVLLTFDLAGPGSRLGAYLLDFVIRYGIFYAAWRLTLIVLPIFGTLPIGGMMVVLFLLEWGYSALFEGLWRGQTPGKRAFRLRVIKDAGYPITFYDAALRNLLRAADILPFAYGVGLISMCSTRRLQRLGDLAAGTIVIHDDKHRFRRDTSLFDHLDPIPPNACSGRYHVSERTLDVIEQLLWRDSRLSKRRMEEIAGLLAVPLADRLGYLLEAESGSTRNIDFLRRILRTFSEGARRE